MAPTSMLETSLLLGVFLASFMSPIADAPMRDHKIAKHVRVASVESHVDAKALANRDPAGLIRQDLEDELGAIDWKGQGVVKPFVVDAVLSDATSDQGKDGAKASCTIKVVVRENDGAILATVSGKAAGSDKNGARASLERDVLGAATHSASEGIPEAVKRSRAQR